MEKTPPGALSRATSPKTGRDSRGPRPNKWIVSAAPFRDRVVHHALRYVDDFAMFHNDRAVLAQWRRRIGRYL